MTRTVSVIIPCYNYARFLPASVTSALEQRDVDVEVLVLDDCSNDATPSVGAQLAEDRRVTFRRHERNIGHIATYNEGLEWAEGDFTVLLSADDMLTPGSLARAVDAFDMRSSIGLVYGTVRWFTSSEDPPAPRSASSNVRVWSGADWIARICKSIWPPVYSPAAVVRTSCYRRLGGYRSDLPHAADFEMWLRIAAHGDVAFVTGVDQALYRVHENSMSHAVFNTTLIDLTERNGAFDALFDTYGATLADSTRLRETAKKALAREALWHACRAYDRGGTACEPVALLEEFASTVFPQATTLREYRSLRTRERLGPQLCGWLQFARPDVYAHRVRRSLTARRVASVGV